MPATIQIEAAQKNTNPVRWCVGTDSATATATAKTIYILTRLEKYTKSYIIYVCRVFSIKNLTYAQGKKVLQFSRPLNSNRVLSRSIEFVLLFLCVNYMVEKLAIIWLKSLDGIQSNRMH